MLANVEIVTIYIFFYVIFSMKVRRGLHSAQTKLMMAKLCAVLANFGFPHIFLKNQHVGPSFSEIFIYKKKCLTPRCVSLRRVDSKQC